MPNTLTPQKPNTHAGGMAGIAYRSVLAPHMEYVRQRRRARATWKEIAEELGKRGVKTSPSNLCEVFTRTTNRKRWPAGMEPTAQAPVRLSDPSNGQEAGNAPMWSSGKRRGKQADAEAGAAVPKVYRSRLEPHLVFIREQRSAGQGWRQIAEALGKLGVKVSFQAVADYHARRQAQDAKAATGAPSQAQAATTTGSQPPPFQAIPTKRKLPGESDDLAGLGLE